MNIIKQKNRKDCLICCLATLLNMDYEEIPKFYEEYPEDRDFNEEEGWAFKRSFDRWLNTQGYFRIIFETNVIDDVIQQPFYTGAKSLKCFGIMKKPDRFFSHVVILDFSSGSVTIHDPANIIQYSYKDLTHIELILKLNDYK